MTGNKVTDAFRLVLNAVLLLLSSFVHLLARIGKGVIDGVLLVATLFAGMVRRDEERERYLGNDAATTRFEARKLAIPAIFMLGFVLGNVTDPMLGGDHTELADAGSVTAIPYYPEKRAAAEGADADVIRHPAQSEGFRLTFSDPESQARENERAADGVKFDEIETAAGQGLGELSPDEAGLEAPQANIEGQSSQDDPLVELAGLRDIFTPKPVGPANGVMKKPEKQAVKPAPEEEVLTVGRGDVLVNMLIKAGVPKTEAHRAMIALKDVYDARSLRPGDEIRVLFEKTDDGDKFIGMRMQPDVAHVIMVGLNDEDLFEATKLEKTVTRHVEGAAGTITTSLFNAGMKAGMPVETLVEMIKLYSWDVDFQRDLRPGDSFEVMYERYRTEDGLETSDGNILFARLTLSGVDMPLYRYEMADGRIDYFNTEGKSVRRALMRTPINGARLSSGFGKRRHPILGYNKMHKGLDFAAPTGTPIFAAGDGVIEKAGRNGGYGNYIKIRHRTGLHTAYAHLSKFAKNMGAGKRVTQGQVIGYVGTTGRSTGPHLHYEVLVENKQVNPRSLKLPTGEVLKGNELAAFKKVHAEFDRQFADIGDSLRVASQ